MAYEPKTWVSGEVIYAVDLNHIEEGIDTLSKKDVEIHHMVVTDGGTRTITDFEGVISVVKNGLEQVDSFTLNWGTREEATEKLTIIFTFDSTVSHTTAEGVTTLRLPLSVTNGDVWEVVYDKFYNIWNLVSVNNTASFDPIPELENGQFLVGGADGNTQRKIVKEDLNMANGTVLCTHGTTGLFNGMPFALTSTANTIVARDFNGRVAVADGTAQDNAVNLKQLNERAGTALPLYNNANANAGTSTLFARQDHVHPLQATVGSLSAGRTFYFTGGMTATSPPFNGSENITVPTTLAVPTETVRGGVLKQANIPDLGSTDTVDVEDINEILAVLRGAGLM